MSTALDVWILAHPFVAMMIAAFFAVAVSGRR